jgi:hypothetical protein
MDSAVLSAASALAGSLIGALSSLAASWLTQREQYRAQALVQEAAQRRTLYSEFITEASKRFVEAWGHPAEGPEVFANLYSEVARMRLTASAEVIRTAEDVVRRMIAEYATPARTFDELQAQVKDEQFADPLKEFSEACRKDLRSLRR